MGEEGHLDPRRTIAPTRFMEKGNMVDEGGVASVCSALGNSTISCRLRRNEYAFTKGTGGLELQSHKEWLEADLPGGM